MTSYKLVEKSPLTIVGIECRTSNAPDAAPQDIPRLWEKFKDDDVVGKIANKSSFEIFGLYCDYENDHTGPYSLVIGCPVSDTTHVPEGMVVRTIPGGSYAVFTSSGEFPKSLIDTWGQIWNSHLPRTFTGDFEVYGDKFFNGSSQEVDIYIAIETMI